MKKLLLIAVMLIGMVATAQTKKDYDDYIKYCNTEISDTVWQYGNVKTKLIPVYSKAGEVVKYVQSNKSDTIWNEVDCKEYMVNTYGQGIIGNSGLLMWEGSSNLSLSSTYTTNAVINTVEDNQPPKDITYEVKQKYICFVKTEKPSQEGFYRWKWKQISK